MTATASPARRQHRRCRCSSARRSSDLRGASSARGRRSPLPGSRSGGHARRRRIARPPAPASPAARRSSSIADPGYPDVLTRRSRRSPACVCLTVAIAPRGDVADFRMSLPGTEDPPKPGRFERHSVRSSRPARGGSGAFAFSARALQRLRPRLAPDRTSALHYRRCETPESLRPVLASGLVPAMLAHDRHGEQSSVRQHVTTANCRRERSTVAQHDTACSMSPPERRTRHRLLRFVFASHSCRHAALVFCTGIFCLETLPRTAARAGTR